MRSIGISVTLVAALCRSIGVDKIVDDLYLTLNVEFLDCPLFQIVGNRSDTVGFLDSEFYDPVK